MSFSNIPDNEQKVPDLYELADLFRKKLTKYYRTMSTEVVECPDLTAKPFSLAAPGICGKPSVFDIGGVPYLFPLPKFDKSPYDLKEIVKSKGYNKALIIGAGCGPYQEIGTNVEFMPNLYFDNTNIINKSYYAQINENNLPICRPISAGYANLLCNIFVSEGLGGKVLKIVVKERISEEKNSLTEILHSIVHDEYSKLHFAIGGVFLIKLGKVKIHIMPNFSKEPINTIAESDKWLKFFNFSSPLVCLTVFHSFDPGLDLRIEHTHCFSDHNEGGHYHNDVTPEFIEYEGYFNVTPRIYRIDKPLTKWP